MRKILIILIFYATNSSAINLKNFSINDDKLNGTEFKSDAAHFSTPHINIGGNSSEWVIYKSKTRDLYFYKPIFHISTNKVIDAIKKALLSAFDNKETELTIEFPIQFYFKSVEDKIVTAINNTLKREKKTAITNSEVSITPFNLLTMYAKIDNDDLRLIHTNPILELNKNINIKSTTKNSLDTTVIAELKATPAELSIFLKKLQTSTTNPFYGIAYYQNVQADTYKVQANIKNFVNSHSFTKLFGDANEQRTQMIKSKLRNNSYGLNIPFFNTGSTDSSSSVEKIDKHKRWISQNLIKDAINDHFNSVNVSSYCAGDTKHCDQQKNQIFEKLLYLFSNKSNKITANFVKNRDNTYKLINEHTKDILTSKIKVHEEFSSQPDNKYSADSSKSGSFEGLLATESNSIDIHNKDHIKFVQQGQKWVPSKVDLYLADKSKLNNVAQIEVLEEIAKSNIMQTLDLRMISSGITQSINVLHELQEEIKKLKGEVETNTKNINNIGMIDTLKSGESLLSGNQVHILENNKKFTDYRNIIVCSKDGISYNDKNCRLIESKLGSTSMDVDGGRGGGDGYQTEFEILSANSFKYKNIDDKGRDSRLYLIQGLYKKAF